MTEQELLEILRRASEKQVRALDLSNNQLTTLSPEIGQLTHLESLDLSNNQLSTLPLDIGYLINLQYLDLSYNPLSQLPPHIRKHAGDPKQAATKIPRYYRQLSEHQTDRLYEAKLLIVGEGGAGKTSLAQKIIDETYSLQATKASTEGIEILQWNFPFKDGKDFRVNIWDFGGQEIYHATHQFFLTKRSLYILVADNRRDDTDFYYWLKIIELLSENSPVLIVKNEKHDQQLDINERQLRGEFKNLKESLATNLAYNRGLPEIKQAIQFYITRLPHVGDELPKSWIKVRNALEDDPRNYITVEEFLQICQDQGFTRHEDKLQLSSYLHDLGVCLHFQTDDLLRKTLILKPTWGTDAVYKVLDNRQVIENLGKFTRQDLATIWHEEKYSNMHPELLRLMLNFKLCYEIPGQPNTYIAPQLLSPEQSNYPWDPTDNLLIRYSYNFMPKGILTRFIVEMHRWIEDQTHVWKTGVVLNKDGSRAEVIELYHRKQIRIRVSGERRRDLLAAIRHEFDKIHDSFEGLEYSTLVPCNCTTCKTLEDPHFYNFNELQERLSHGKLTIECAKVPYLSVEIHSLIDDITPRSFSKPHNQKNKSGEDHPQSLSTSQQPKIYRFTLPLGVSNKQKKLFHDEVERIRQANPNWNVEQDDPFPGEEEAILLIHKDNNAARLEAAYILSRTLSDLSEAFRL